RIGLFVERHREMAGRDRAASTDEISVWVGENASEHCSAIERREAEEIRLRSTRCIFDANRERGESEPKRIFGRRREAHSECPGAGSAQRLPESSAYRVPRRRYSEKNRVS